MSRPEKLLRPSEAAKRLGIDPSTLRRYAACGEIQAVLTPGGHHRYRDSELRNLVARRGKEQR